jgi:hypothetical protein
VELDRKLPYADERRKKTGTVNQHPKRVSVITASKKTETMKTTTVA